jgi:hypothetical protein
MPSCAAPKLLNGADTEGGWSRFLASTVADAAANLVSTNADGHVAVRATLADGKQLISRADPTD